MLSCICLLISCTKPLTLCSQYEMHQADKRYAMGVSAQYAGVLQEYLIQAGGCNFPDVPAAKGGSKVFYDHIYAASLPVDGSDWIEIGKLPFAAAYGVTVAYNNALYLIGGLSPNVALKCVLRLTMHNGKAVVERLHDLPYPMDNMTGAVIGDKLYLIGGNVEGKPSHAVWCGDLSHQQMHFERLEDVPGEARLQGVCTGIANNLCLFSGYCPPFEGKDGFIHEQGYCFDVQKKTWLTILAPKDESGKIVSLSGGCAVAVDQSHILCVGGVNRDVFPIGLNGIEEGETWLSHPVEWYKFNRQVLLYDMNKKQWQILGELEGTARAGGALVKYKDLYYMMQGEIMPGIRTPKITEFTFKP